MQPAHRIFLSAVVFCSALTPVAVRAEEEPLTGAVVADDGSRAREASFETARGMGMGTGGRASAVGSSALAYNPANLSLQRSYHIEAFGSYIPGDKTWAIGSSVTDSVTNSVAAGFSLHGIYGNGSRSYRGIDGRLGLGLPIGDMLAIGVSGRYLRLKSELTNENGEAIGPELTAFTMDAALRLTLVPGLHVAALGHNLIPTDSSLAPMLLGGSVSYAYETLFSVSVDAFADMTTFVNPSLIIGGGAEVLIAGQLPIRAGYRHEAGRELHQVTGSLGYVSQTMGIDLALRQDVSGGSETSLLMNLRYHVQ